MAKETIPPLQWLRNQIETLHTDLVGQMLKMIAEFLMGLDADQRWAGTTDPRSLAIYNVTS